MGEIVDFVVQRSSPSTVDKLITDYELKHYGEEQLMVLSSVLSMNEMIRSVVSSLGEYLTDIVPDPTCEDRSLFDRCLSVATNEWIFALTQTSDDGLRCAYFLRGLVAPLPSVMRYSICDPQSREQAWDPLNETLATWWAARRRDVDVRPVSETAYWQGMMPIEFRTVVCSRFLFAKGAVLPRVARFLDFIVDR